MMKFIPRILIAFLLVAGCDNQSANKIDNSSPEETTDANGAAKPAGGDEAKASPMIGGADVVTLSPENTKIVFVGTHVGPEPDPNAREGRFEKFIGEAKIDREKKSLKSVAVEIETASITTENPKLTNHLRTPDFFEVQEYPSAKFESTGIEKVGDGEEQYQITGNLTLLETTKEISFPGTVNVTDEGLTLNAEFTIDRTEFGMDKLQDRVNKEVSMKITVEDSTQNQQ